MNAPKLLPVLLCAAMSAAVLAGCGGTSAADRLPPSAPETAAVSATPAPTPVPTPQPTPVPTPTPVPEVTLTGDGVDEILALPEVPGLEYVDAGASTEYDALARMQEQLPEVVIDYEVDLGGVPVRSTAQWADLTGSYITPYELADKLALLPGLKTVDITQLGWTNDQSLIVVDRCPDKNIIWTVRFGRWAVRSDITCFSSLQWAAPDHRYTQEELAPLFTYCKNLHALDLGHNNITDVTMIGQLPELRVLILGDNTGLRDLSPLANLTKLQYIEFFMGYYVSDFSFLNALTEMRNLNLGYCYQLTDVSFLDNMPLLQTCWFPGTGIPREQHEAIRAKYPNVRFLFIPSLRSSTSDGWRATPDNLTVRFAFGNWPNVTDFYDLDRVEYRQGVYLNPVSPAYS